MKLTLVTPRKVIFDGTVEYLVVHGDNGELAILDNHVPTVVSIKEGFVKRVFQTKEETYSYIIGGLLEFSIQVITLICQNAVDGKTLDDAKKKYDLYKKTLDENNKIQALNFAEIERKLALSIKEIKAGNL